MTDLFNLFVSFARVTLFGFGGGPSMIPLIRSEVVEVRGWPTPQAGTVPARGPIGDQGQERQHSAGCITGIRPVVVALLLLVAWDLGPNALGGLGELGVMRPRWLIAAGSSSSRCSTTSTTLSSSSWAAYWEWCSGWGRERRVGHA